MDNECLYIEPSKDYIQAPFSETPLPRTQASEHPTIQPSIHSSKHPLEEPPSENPSIQASLGRCAEP